MKKKAVVTAIETARARRASAAGEAGRVEVYTVGIEGLENLFRQTIIDRLGADKGALKAFEVAEYQPTNDEQAAALKRLGRPLFVVKGALGLNDAGIGWKAFEVHVEQNLSDREDREIADALAHQCLICVAKMKRELWRYAGQAANA